MFRFSKNRDWIKSIDLYGWFQLYYRYLLGRRSYDDERQIAEDCNKYRKSEEEEKEAKKAYGRDR